MMPGSRVPLSRVAWRPGYLESDMTILRSAMRSCAVGMAAVGAALVVAALAEAAETAAAPSAEAKQKVVVRFSWKLKGEYAPLFVALDKGYYAAEGDRK